MSRRSGSGKWAGSRSAAPMNGITISPAWIVSPPLGDEATEVVGQGVAGVGAPSRQVRVRGLKDQVETPSDLEAPALEPLVVLDGDAQHFADHDDGQRVGELLDEVHGARALHPLEQAV